MFKVDLILTWIIIILGLILAVMLFVIPKDNCDLCSFDGLNGKKWFESYSDKCLQRYSYGQPNPNFEKTNITSLAISSGDNALQVLDQTNLHT